eukprot:TRINITY_DN59987_c0_g1_i1.p1 TRINITY_DN59987_c0_g1~~TRINITY_DN59987_c0_g1_i1.p1  ORF type:complete len:830 (+),score=90.03 TRINITY_DN59987_c0_g1_i1:76-2490(+)
MESISGASIVARVCGQDPSIHNSGAQFQLGKDVSSYIKPKTTGFGNILSARVLCTVALLVWCLMVSKEVHLTVDIQRAVASLPRGDMKLEGLSVASKSTVYRLRSMTLKRSAFCAMAALYRLASAFALLYSGIVFLAQEVNIKDLVLNTVALEIILNLHTVLFEALAPTPAKHLFKHLEALSVPSWPRYRGLDIKSAIMSLIIPAIGALAILLVLQPMTDSLQEMLDTMCGGNTDFIIDQHPESGIVYAVPTPEYSGSGDIDSVIDAQLLYRLTKSKAYENESKGLWELADSGEMQLALLSSFASFADEHGVCEDLDAFTSVDYKYWPILYALRSRIGNDSLESCKDVDVAWCSSIDGKMVRFACPRRCGCHLVTFGGYLLEGCPTKSCSQTVQFQESLLWMPDRDVDVEVLSHSSTWREYWKEYEQTMIAKPSLNTLEVDPTDVKRRFIRLGCRGLEGIINITMRAEQTRTFFCGMASQLTSPSFRPLTVFCQETCHCSNRYDDHQDLFCAKTKISQVPRSACPDLLISIMRALGNCAVLPFERRIVSGKYYCWRDGLGGTPRWTKLGNQMLEIRAESPWGLSYHNLTTHLRGERGIIWTLAVRQGGEVSQNLDAGVLRRPLFYAVTSSKAFPESGWRPVEVVTSEATCTEASFGIAARFVSGEWAVAKTEEDCLDACLEINRSCDQDAWWVHNFDIADQDALWSMLDSSTIERFHSKLSWSRNTCRSVAEAPDVAFRYAPNFTIRLTMDDPPMILRDNCFFSSALRELRFRCRVAVRGSRRRRSEKYDARWPHEICWCSNDV